MGYTVQDEVEEFIVSMLDQGYTKAEIIEEIPEVFDGFDIGLASDAYEDYENDNDPKNEEATVGDIERFIDELEVEGFPRDEAIARATKRFKLSAQEIRSMIESTANQEVLQYLDNLTETLDKVVEGWDEANEVESDNVSLTQSQLVELMKALVREEGWDEEEAATYIIETEVMESDAFNSDDPVHTSREIDAEDELIADLLDAYYDSIYNS